VLGWDGTRGGALGVGRWGLTLCAGGAIHTQSKLADRARVVQTESKRLEALRRGIDERASELNSLRSGVTLEAEKARQAIVMVSESVVYTNPPSRIHVSTSKHTHTFGFFAFSLLKKKKKNVLPKGGNQP